MAYDHFLSLVYFFLSSYFDVKLNGNNHTGCAAIVTDHNQNGKGHL